jgi:hypothetical protein
MMDQGCCRADDRSAHHRYRPYAAGAGHADGPFGLPPVLPPAGTPGGRSFRWVCVQSHTGMAAATDNAVVPTVEPINVPNAPHVRQPIAARHFAPGVGLPNPLRHVASRQLLRGSNTRLRRPAPCRRPECPAENVSPPGPHRIEHCGSDQSAPSEKQPPPWGIRPFHGDHCTLRRRVFRLWSG